MDETYIKVKGVWKYLYRAMNKQGQTIDFLLSEKRDKEVARQFFNKAMQHHDPETVTLDQSVANKAAMDGINVNRNIFINA